MTIGVSPTGSPAIGVSHTACSRCPTRLHAPTGGIPQASLWISIGFRSALPIAPSGYHPPLHRGITHLAIGVSHTESRGIAHRPSLRLRRKAALSPRFLRLNLLNDSFLTESLTRQRCVAMTGISSRRWVPSTSPLLAEKPDGGLRPLAIGKVRARTAIPTTNRISKMRAGCPLCLRCVIKNTRGRHGLL